MVNDAIEICHHCGKTIEEDTNFVAMSAKHNGSKHMVDVHLAFHFPCFREIAGEDYSNALGTKIENWIKERKAEREALEQIAQREHERKKKVKNESSKEVVEITQEDLRRAFAEMEK